MINISAKYIYRIDDITEDMNWEAFNRCINIFKKYNVVPLIGVVPLNKDEDLKVGKLDKLFYVKMKEMKDSGSVEICQHGYNHILDSEGEGIFKSKFGFKCSSEFAGKSYEEQYYILKEGKDILMYNGINVDTFMAPSHTFDLNTLRALRDLEFKYITDGIGLTPYEIENMKLIPQQFGKPRNFPLGVVTICLHINKYNEVDFKNLEKHIIKNQKNIIKFSEGVLYKERKIINIIFKVAYLSIRYIKNKIVYSR